MKAEQTLEQRAEEYYSSISNNRTILEIMMGFAEKYAKEEQIKLLERLIEKWEEERDSYNGATEGHIATDDCIADAKEELSKLKEA